MRRWTPDGRPPVTTDALRPGLLLDRDGTLTHERGYLADPDQLEPIAGAVEAVARARAAGWALGVITNQSAVARGIVSEDQLATLHRRQITAAIRRGKPDVILSWMNRATMMTRPAGRPHVARLGGFYNLKYYRGCDWLVANTRDIADYLIANGVPRERVHYQINFVPDGREGSIFGGPVSEGKQGDGPVIAALGRLHENKAFDTLIRAFAARHTDCAQTPNLR